MVTNTPRMPVTINACGKLNAARSGITAAKAISVIFSCLYHRWQEALFRSYQPIWSSSRSMIGSGDKVAAAALMAAYSRTCQSQSKPRIGSNFHNVFSLGFSNAFPRPPLTPAGAARLCPRLVNHLLPNPLRLDDQFNRLSYRPATGKSFRCEMRCFLYLRHSIPDRNRQPDASHHLQIRQVISYIRDRGFRHTRLPEDIFVRRNLGRLLHIDKFHLHFIGAPQQRGTLASGDTTRPDSRGVGERLYLSVLCVKRFE